MQQRIITIIPLDIRLPLLQQLEENIIMMIPQSNNQRTPPKIIPSTFDILGKDQFYNLTVSCAGSQMKYGKSLFCLLHDVYQGVVQQDC